MQIDEIAQLTAEYGEGWALPHAQRVLKLVAQIDAGLEYDHEALAYAVYLHDWGAFTRFRRAGVDHGLRSRQVAEAEILPHTALTAEQKNLILDAIEYHDYRCTLPVWTQEAILLREADFLDFLGALGVAREFAWGSASMQAAYDRIVIRRDMLRERFTIPAAQRLAAERLARMDQVLAWLKEESLGSL